MAQQQQAPFFCPLSLQVALPSCRPSRPEPTCRQKPAPAAGQAAVAAATGVGGWEGRQGGCTLQLAAPCSTEPQGSSARRSASHLLHCLLASSTLGSGLLLRLGLCRQARAGQAEQPEQAAEVAAGAAAIPGLGLQHWGLSGFRPSRALSWVNGCAAHSQQAAHPA